MSAKFTPGPWKVGDEEPFVYSLNERGANRWFASVQPGWTDGAARTGHDELMSNARLIAAAPELYELVRALVVTREKHFICNEGDGLYGWDERARAALAKVDA